MSSINLFKYKFNNIKEIFQFSFFFFLIYIRYYMHIIYYFIIIIIKFVDLIFT